MVRRLPILMAHHHDPAPAVDKVLEIVLYLVVGAMTGWLVERERHARDELAKWGVALECVV